MPFVQNMSGSETLGITVPPAHMQNVKTSRSAAGDQRVIGRPQQLDVFASAIFLAVDLFLRLLDPQSQLKCLGGHGDAGLEQHPVRVAGTVSDRQDDGTRRER